MLHFYTFFANLTGLNYHLVAAIFGAVGLILIFVLNRSTQPGSYSRSYVRTDAVTQGVKVSPIIFDKTYTSWHAEHFAHVHYQDPFKD